MINLINENELNIKAFSKTLDSNVIQNSYKIFWILAIIEEVNKGKKRLLFDDLIIRIVYHSWVPIIMYKLDFGYWDKIADLVNEVNLYCESKRNIEISKINEIIKNNDNPKINKLIKDRYKYVPYRFLTPFYENKLRGKKDGIKNKMIADMTKNDNEVIYKIYEDKNIILINDDWYDFIRKHYLIIKGWIREKLIVFLQNKNPNVPAIPFKIDEINNRNLDNERKFWKKVLKINSIRDIYSNNVIREDDYFELDHYIPWSFVSHNYIWNLIPTSKSNNLLKSDRLPKIEENFNDFLELQYAVYEIVMKNRNNFNRKIVEGYYYLNKNISIRKNITTKKVFKEYLSSVIKSQYEIAFNQGFKEMI